MHISPITAALILLVFSFLPPLHAQEVAEAPATESPAAESPAEEGEAASTAEPVAPAVVQAEDTASLQTKVGSEVIVEGVVKSVGKGPNDGITFLNFGDRKSGFVAVIFRPTYDKFPDGFDKYSNQKVRVKGALENFRDRQLQIRISTPDQLEIIATTP
jgi:hypothetical protein